MRVGRYALPALLLSFASLSCTAFAPRPAWEVPPLLVSDTPVVRAGALQRRSLSNGLDVIVLEDHRLPRVSLGIAFRRGGASVAPERAGLAAFTTSLMKRGAADRDALALARAVDEIGGSLSVSSDWDSTTAQVAGLSRDLDTLFSVLRDVVLEPRFDEAEAGRTQGEMLASLERAKDDPGSLVYRFLLESLYPGLRAGLSLQGTPDTVVALDADAAREFHRRIAIPNDALLFASGDVDTADLMRRVEAAFGEWARATALGPGPPLPVPTPEAAEVTLVDRPDMVQAHIALAHEGIARTNPERVSAGLMNSVLGGGGFSSRLMNRVRSEAGLAYGVSSGFSMRRGGGIFSISTATRVTEVRRVVDLLVAEVERMRAEPPSEAELQAARSLAVGSFQLALETSDAVLGALVDLDVYGLPEDSLDTYRARVLATTPEDVSRLAQELLHPDRFSIVVVGPAEQLEPELEGLGPVRVVTP